MLRAVAAERRVRRAAMKGAVMVERVAVNPWAWSVNFGFNQGSS